MSFTPKWLSKGLAVAKKAIENRGLHTATRLKLPPHPPELLEIKQVIQPGDYVIKYRLREDPELNHFRVPTLFQIFTSVNGAAYIETGSSDGDDLEVTMLANSLGAGTLRYYVRAINEYGYNDSAVYVVNR